MRNDRRNVLILATCQMLHGSARSLLISTAPLVALAMTDKKALATLPTSLVIVGTAFAAIPAALLMRHLGRRGGFIVGALLGVAGGIVCTYFAVHSNIWLFALGALLFGLFSGFSQLYRFAATDVSAIDYRSTAISLVLAGGVIAAFVGPEAAKLSQDLIASTRFAGGYVVLAAMCLIAALVLMALKIPHQTRAERQGPRRLLAAIMRQPVFIAATVSGLAVQGVMNLLMTATPIAMHHVQHQFDDTAFVIEWHIFAMFAPALIAGWLVKRFGEVAIIQAGLITQYVSIAVALAGEGVWHFWLANLLTGLGWCFTFTAATTLTTYAYTPAERDATQGATNFIIYGFVALLSLAAGALVHYLGWAWVNLGSLPLLVAASAVMFWYSRKPQHSLAAVEEA